MTLEALYLAAWVDGLDRMTPDRPRGRCAGTGRAVVRGDRYASDRCSECARVIDYTRTDGTAGAHHA